MATYPTIPSQPPLEVDVKVSLNGDHITPVSFGPSITYQFPELYTTDKISEIVVGSMPMNFMRLRGIFGANTMNVSNSYISDETLVNQFGDMSNSVSSTVGVSSPSISSRPVDDVITYKYTAGLPHAWDQSDDPLYYPTIDFFPRFNQWFAATTWPYPFNGINALVPQYYTIYLIYVDRVLKKTYWREARANLVVGQLPPGLTPLPSSVY